MFCKWCGGDLLSSDTKCKRCGRDVPALSDCGGFYDLVPNAKKNSESYPLMQVEVQPTLEAVTDGKKNKKRLPLGFKVLTAAGIIIVLLLSVIVVLVIALGKSNRSKVKSSAYSFEKTEISEWQYRLGEDSEWKALPKDAYQQKDSKRKTVVTINEEWLQEMIEKNEGQLEFRCEINRTDSDKDSFRIIFEDI
jgi:hypothetical protein